MVRIGDSGETSTPLTPGGFVEIEGTRLPARCESGFIEIREAIVVIGGDNLGLIVRRVAVLDVTTPLHRHGEVVFASFGAKVKSLGTAAELRERELLQRAQHHSLVLGSFTGGLAGGAIIFGLGLYPNVNPILLTPIGSLLTVLISIAWGAFVGRVLFGMFHRMGYEQVRGIVAVSIVATVLIAGLTFGLVARSHALVASVCSALSATAVLGGSFSALAFLGEWLGGDQEGTSTESSSKESH